MLTKSNMACLGYFFTLFIPMFIFSCLETPLARADVRTVTVGIYENAPKVFTSESGKPSGIFVDVIEAIAKTEGWNLRYVPGTWAEGLDRLEKGEIDLMPDVAYTTEREKIYSFHKIPVLTVWSQLYAPKGSGIQSLLDLNGKRVAALEQTIQLETFRRLTNSFGLNITLIPVQDYKTEFEMLAAGKADAGLTNRLYGLMYARKYGLEDTPVMFDPAPFFFAARRNSPGGLLEIIDRHLSEMKKDPQSAYYAAMKRWTSEEVQFKMPAWLQIFGLVLGVVLLMSLAGSFVLKHQVNARTEELQTGERKYRELVQNANSIILRWNRAGEVTFLNEFGQKFFGYSEAEILGRHVVGTIVPESESTGRDLSPLMDKILVHPEDFEKNINENMRRNGDRVWISWTNKIVKDNRGQVLEILSIGSDITEQKQTEEELEKHRLHLEDMVKERTLELETANIKLRELDRLKSLFIASMSHELRTPLNSIIGFTGILLQGLAGPLNDEQRKQLGMVKGSSHHLLELITDIIDISKIEAGKLSLSLGYFDLSATARGVLESLQPAAGRKSLKLTLEAPAQLQVKSDERRIRQVLVNLIGNAVKFTPSGEVSVAVKGENGGAQVSVRDTGPGIRPEDMGRLFQFFSQITYKDMPKNEGTGLGLYLSKKLMNLLGGDIQAESEFGKGSVFTMILPPNEEKT